MATVRYYLYSIFVGFCIALIPALFFVFLVSPVFVGQHLIVILVAFLPIVLLFIVTNGCAIAAKLFNGIGMHALSERCYLNQIRVEKLRCHPDEFRIDYAGQDLADFYLSIGEVEKAVSLTMSIFDWKEKSSRRADPEHTQNAFSFAQRLIAGGYQRNAQDFLLRVVRRRESVFGETHPSVGEAYLHLGNCYTACDAELARAAYESAIPCFYRSQLELKEKSRVYFNGKKLKSEIVYLRVTTFSNLASLAYSLGDLATSSHYLEKCTYELHQNEISTLMLSNCRDIVLAQSAQILIDQNQSDEMLMLYGSFKRPAPSASKVGLLLDKAKRNARLLSERWSLWALWCYRPIFFLLEPFGGFWTTWMTPVAVVAAHRE